MIKKYLKQKESEFNYVLTAPDNLGENLPLVIFLHGAGERGNSLDKLKKYGITKRAEYFEKMPAVTLCPQCEDNKVWSSEVYRLKALIDEIIEKYKVNKEKIYMIGCSMGAFGTWTMAMEFPKFFRAIVPICGGGMAWRADVIKDLRIHAFHGSEDDVVNVFYSIDLIEKLKSLGSTATLTVLEGYTHNSWDYVFEEYNIVEKIVFEDKI